MLINYQLIENIYLVCGKTDMRLDIDGLALIVQDKFELNLYQNALFLFAGDVQIVSKPFIGMVTPSSYCINELKTAHCIGHVNANIRMYINDKIRLYNRSKYWILIMR